MSRRFVLIKDHLCQDRIDRAILSFMDWVGNRAYGVNLPYNYQSKTQWQKILSLCEMRAVSWNDALSLYPAPFDYLFGGGLHFLGLCEKAEASCG